MLKINDYLDKHSLKIQKDSDEKEPGFAKLEEHIQTMILNASAIPPFESCATEPTEFYLKFFKNESQFKAKDLLAHRLILEKVSFNPGASFVTCLWNADLFWILPDSPSGISIFFCPESKSLHATELEKERCFALIDKVKVNDLEKLSKQKLHLPTSIIDMIFMTQNLYTGISLCFGESSNSALFLLGWANHMNENRLMYSNLQASDSSFFAKVLFSIDNALQFHWSSCCNSRDRMSVDDKVLLIQDSQDMILHHNFIQQLPKSIKDKIIKPKEDKKVPGKLLGQ
jgi:hypothetical protein